MTVPDNSADPVVIHSGAAQITVTLPGAAADATPIAEDLVGFDGGDGSTAVPAVKDDGSVQFLSVIDGVSSALRAVSALPGSALVECARQDERSRQAAGARRNPLTS